MAIYLKYGDIKGDCETDGWKDWIIVESCQLGCGRGIGSAKNRGSNREGTEPNLSEIVVTKTWDAKSSSKLFEESVAGPLDRKVEIHFSTTSEKKQEAYLIVKLKDAGISSYSLSSGGSQPSESLSINFAHIEIVPKIIGHGLKATDGTKVSFDLKVMKPNV